MKTIEKIRQKIEELYDGEAPAHDQQCEFEDGYFMGIDTISNFLDTLESEKPMNQEGLEEEIDKRYLQTRVVGYQDGVGEILLGREAFGRIARHFAQWGAEHTPLPEDTVLFNKGVEEGKRLMMEEAVEGEVEYNYDEKGRAYYTIRPLWITGNIGDKVRIIIFPKED